MASAIQAAARKRLNHEIDDLTAASLAGSYSVSEALSELNDRLAVRVGGPSGPLDADLQRELVNREVAFKAIDGKQDGDWTPGLGKFRRQAIQEIESQSGRLQSREKLLRELENKAKTIDELYPQLRAFERKARRLWSVQMNRLRQSIPDRNYRDKVELRLTELYLKAYEEAVRHVGKQL